MPSWAITCWLCVAALGFAAERDILAVRTDHPPRMDGAIDDTWASAATITAFHQREPFEGRPETEKTVVHILYDRRYLYFGIQCFDSNPAGIVANELRRDTDFTVDDHVSVMISPNNDARSGYVFTTNPLGTQFDRLIANEGAIEDPNWDAVWISNAAISSHGWSATIAIPFSSLNFKASADVTIGLNFLRFIRRKNEEDLWQSYLRIYGLERVSEGGRLTGLQDIGSGRLLVIKPYALGGLVSNSALGDRALHTGGLDVKYGIRSNVVANLTVNTDFADADVDPLRVNITPFKNSLPEKRPFFLENGGFFHFGAQESTQLFFSRQIGIDPNTGEQVPLDVGAKLTGTLGDYDIGFLDARTRTSGFNPWANYVVARVKRKILSESYIGAILIDKESGNPLDQFNRTGGVDASFLLFKRLTLSGYYAKTSSFAPQLRGRDWAEGFVAAYDSNLIQAQWRHSIVQPNFNPEVGFVDRTDLIANFYDFQLSPRPKTGPVREYNFEGFYSRDPDTHGVLQTQEWQTTFRALFHNGSYTDDDLVDNFIQRLSTPFNIFRNVFIPAGVYHFDRHQFTYGSDASKRWVYGFFERFGTYYNGTLNEARVRGSYRPTPKVSLAAVETYDRFRLAGRLYNVHIGSLNTSYSFNRFLTTSVLAQVNTIEKNPVSLNFRLRYTYRPDSDLFVIYNIGSQFNSIAAGNPVLLREQRLTVKFTYSFSP
ncbi:MAG TPA: DUF5916 domain-containing protein [Bryobacteraceae bacterium]|nr:DUF5916 domain-containing protein [Bryobacteraceae bacterium]